MKKLFSMLLALGALGIFQAHATVSKWQFSELSFKNKNIRTGIKRHIESQYKGTIIYQQGLADSMLNHEPLFNYMAEAGYDIIAFDYMGQGGSEGSMNATRIDNINELTDKVWNKYTYRSKRKIILGWSTGGLAAYKYAYQKPESTKAIILLAPGIVAKYFVGKTQLWGCLFVSYIRHLDRCKLVRITESSLTQNKFQDNNPHIDPIIPNSPIKVPKFALNLLRTSRESRNWLISKEVKGMVYLSSDEDTYVNGKKTIDVIKKNAPHFGYYQFGLGALHELDNEVPKVTSYLYRDIVSFLSEL